jgi:branched-chain amino acid transport system ATP-binding protein
MSMLEVKGLNVHYGDFHAIRDLSMKVEENSLVSLIGANGAGKSTLINAICGINKVSSGSITFLGKDITNMKTSRIVSKGLTSSPEGSHCFENMTVRDNLLMGAYLSKSAAERYERLEEIFELFPILKEKAKQLSTFLSGGQRQMLAIGRAIMTKPKLLICDEVSLGLAPVIIGDIYAKLSEISAKGITLVIIEQDIRRSLSCSDYAYVMLEGKIVMEGKSEELDLEEVNEAYFGIDKYASLAGIHSN